MKSPTSPTPIPIRVAAHPWVPGRFTHVVSQRDALARGWLTTCDLHLGTWRTRAAARAYARKLQGHGVVVIREARA